MTTISNSSSGSSVSQLLGTSSNTQVDSGTAIVDAMNAARKAKVKATDSSSTTTGSLNLSDNVLNLLQGLQGAEYMKQMLDTGSSSNAAYTAMLGGSISSNLLQSALSGARQKQYSVAATQSTVQSLVDSTNAALNAATKAKLNITS